MMFPVTSLGKGGLRLCRITFYSPLTLLIVLSTSLEIASAASNPVPISPTFFGMHVAAPDREWPPLPFGALGKAAGSTWAYVEPERGVFQWYGMDHYVAAAEIHRVDAFYAFANTPQWASARPKEHCYRGDVGCAAPPSNIEYWNEFVRALATRYKGRIKFYEIWDEANDWPSWSGTPAELVRLAKEAFAIIKSIDADAIVLTPAVSGQPGYRPHDNPVNGESVIWMQRYLQAGGNQYADGGNWHAYLMPTVDKPYRMPEDGVSPCFIASWNYAKSCYGSLLNEIDSMRTIFDRNGLAGKPMFNTEGSWGKGAITDPDLQAAWLARYYLLQAGKGIRGVYWYGWGTDQWGDLESGDKRLNAAGVAYTETYKWLVGATITGACAQTNRVTWTCGLTRPGSYWGLAVWSTSGEQTFTVEPKYRQYRDLMGRIVPVQGSAKIGSKPILLETFSPGRENGSR